MTSTTREPQQISPARVAFASGIGTAIEWYDFFIFNTAAALVFNTLFFPTFSPAAGTLAAFGTFGVAFAARPLGGVIFGHFGDRIGRKKILVFSLLLMGISTFAIGLLPTYAAAGVWAPALLVTARVLQGLAVGGEWSGAVLMATEHAPEGKRGFYGSWPQAGVPVGLVLSSGTFFLLTNLLPTDQFLAWGWRIPFLISATLVAVGLYIRLRIIESPAFREVQETANTSALPILDVLRTAKKQLVIGMGTTAAPNIPFYVATVFTLTYVPAETGVPRETVLLCLLAAAVLQIVTIPAVSLWSDRVGRRPVLLTGAIATALLAFPYFWLLETGSVPLILLALVLAIPVLHALTYSPQASFLSELFDTRLRYTGSSVSYQFGGVVSSGPTPFVAAALLGWAGSTWAISVYIIIGALVSIVAVAAARETFRHEIHKKSPSTSAPQTVPAPVDDLA